MMAIFLNYPPADYSSKNRQGWQNTYLKDDLGKVIQVRGMGRTSPFWTVTLDYDRPVSDPTEAFNMSVFISALRSLQGGAVQCFFYTPSPWDWWDDAPAGVADGTNLTFPFGGCNLVAIDQLLPVVKLNGTPVPQYAVGGINPVWTVAALPDDLYNRWAVVFDAGHAPALGSVVQVSFMGCRLLLGQLIADPGEQTVPGYARLQFTVQLQGEEV
jgi:hypothetical protein